MPLLRRELQELAQKKRTYGLRCLVWLVFLFVFLLVYIEVTSRASTVMYILGRGNDMSEALFITLILTVYVLNPIMACTAITSEKEKQTLGLLIISKMSPVEIVVQKIFSHMLPLISLLLVSTPLFAIAYLFGGVSFDVSMAGLVIMLAAIVQITTVAVFCSALLESGVAAFWATYGVLAVIYFTLPIMREMDLIRLDFGTLPDEEFLLFPIYQLAMVMGSRGEISDVLPMTVATCMITLLFAVGAVFAVVRFSYGGAFSFLKVLGVVWKEMKSMVRFTVSRNDHETEDVAGENIAADGHNAILSQRLIHTAPITWREMKKRILGSWKLQLGVIVGLVCFVMMLLSAYGNDEEEILAFFSLGGMIAGVLLIISVSCRLFATERERQTLDSLLTAPVTNRELVGQKLGAVNRLILILLVPLGCFGILNMFEVDIRIYEDVWVQANDVTRTVVSDRRRVDVSVWSSRWYEELFHYLTCSLGCAFIYMHLVKWIALYWGLRLNTQMKAMMTSILLTLGICLVPMALMAMGMIATDQDPDDLPFFFFSSPLIIPAVNEFHDLYQIYRRSSFVSSSLAVILLHCFVYGSLTLLLRQFVLSSVPKLLQRPEVRDPAKSEDSTPATATVV